MKPRTPYVQFVLQGSAFEIIVLLDQEIACWLSSAQSGGRNSPIHGSRAFEIWQIEKLNV